MTKKKLCLKPMNKTVKKLNCRVFAHRKIVCKDSVSDYITFVAVRSEARDGCLAGVREGRDSSSYTCQSRSDITSDRGHLQSQAYNNLQTLTHSRLLEVRLLGVVRQSRLQKI